jgi:hypothetical protein
MVMMHRQYVARRVAAGLLLAMVVAAWMAVASEDFSLEFVDVSPKAGIIGETVYLEAVVRNNAPLPAENGPDVPLRAEEVVVTFTVDGRLLTTKTLDILNRPGFDGGFVSRKMTTWRGGKTHGEGIEVSTRVSRTGGAIGTGSRSPGFRSCSRSWNTSQDTTRLDAAG